MDPAIERLLVIVATPAEAEPLAARLGGFEGTLGGVRLRILDLGVGKVATASGLARALEAHGPTPVIQLGIGGTYVGSFLPVGGVAVAEVEHDLDFGVASSQRWEGASALGLPLAGPELGNRVPTDAALTARLSARGRVPVVPFGTSDAVSGDLDVAEQRRSRFDLAVESMEGASAAFVARRFDVPFAEVRGISNVAGQRDKGTWEIRAALHAATDVLVRMLDHRD